MSHSFSQKSTTIHFEPLEPRILFDAVPDVSVATGGLTVAGDQLVNDDIDFAVQFDNTGDQIGYAPYVDLIAPAEVQLNSIKLFGVDQTNPNGLAIVPIGEIGADGQLIEVGSSASPVPVDHPMYSNSIGNPPSDYFGGAGSGTTPVTFNPALAGSYVYNVELPFGSYSDSNPALDLSVNASLNTADGVVPNHPGGYDLIARGGFALGHDALDNPGTTVAPNDEPLFGTESSSNVYPLVMQLTKTAAVPEEDGTYTGELASGPNHPVTYTLAVDVADNETITGLNLTDVLPGDLAYLGNLVVEDVGGNALAYTLNSEPYINTDGLTGTPAGDNLLDITLVNPVTGVAGRDIVVTYEAFIPHVDGDTAASVINQVSGEQLDIAPYNDAAISGTWNGNPVSDNEGPAGISQDGITSGLETDYVLEEHSLAIQKGVANIDDRNAPVNSPGDILEYTMNFQVSDYFAFDDLVVDDLLGDGLDFLPGDARGGFVTDGMEIVPQLTFTQHGQTITVDFDSANYTSVLNADGTTDLHFDVYSQLQSDHPLLNGGDPVLGGLVPSGGLSGASIDPATFNAGATTGTITYRAQIRNAHTIIAGDEEISQGDDLVNSATISGNNLDTDDLTSHNQTVTDGSSASISIPVGTLAKEIVAITSHGTTTHDPVNINVVAGDLITYKITYDLPTTEFEQLRFEDFLPLPVFNVAGIDDSMVYDFDAVDSYATAGRISVGPGDTFYGPGGIDDTSDGGIDDMVYPSLTGLDPVIDKATLSASNGFSITVGDYSVGANPSTSRSIEFLVTVEIVDGEYADGLQFTNQVGAWESNSQLLAVSATAIAQIDLVEPEIDIQKGVVATTHPDGTFSGSTGPAGVVFNSPGSADAFTGVIESSGIATEPIDANLNSSDAGDIVTFVLTIENTGSSQYGAFDVGILDTIPTGFAAPGGDLNLRVTDGAGNDINYTGDLFAGGLFLTDPSIDTGSLSTYSATGGANLAIIAYDLQVQNSVSASESLVNVAEIINYSS
ncbi:MAG: LEPR-XLL domain-containing protein, partial [Verrucomicrobiales bacterium]|nr:LEPR-XLL domain-containing protein [Verrucomicrobiales bacterium]